MIEQHHSAGDFAPTLLRARRNLCLPWVRMAMSLVLAAGVSGCGHKVPYVLPPSATAPAELEIPYGPDDPPMIAEEPTPEVEPPAQPVEPPKPVVRKRPTPAPTPKDAPPAQVASVEPATLAIGDLSSGGESTTQSQQQAKDLISGIMKRLSGLAGKTASQKKDEVRQVRHFLQQAQQALDSGDAEGAKNLATKASLLMDDVEKK